VLASPLHSITAIHANPCSVTRFSFSTARILRELPTAELGMQPPAWVPYSIPDVVRSLSKVWECEWVPDGTVVESVS